MDFTAIAYEKIIDGATTSSNSTINSRDEQHADLTEGITINIRVTTKDKEKLDNLTSFIEEVEESGKRYGFELS